MIKSYTFLASVSALLLSTATVSAQPKPADKAIDALGTYVSIIAVSETCKFEVTQPVKDAVSANMKTLQPVSGLTEAQIGEMVSAGMTSAAAKKDGICIMGQDKFNGFIASQSADAGVAGTAAGVTLLPVPVNSAVAVAPPADPKKEAIDLLALSHLVELVSDECEIELTDEETSKLEKAQEYYRGAAGMTEDQVTAMSDAMEKEVTKGKKEFCSPAFGFKAQLKKVLLSVK